MEDQFSFEVMYKGAERQFAGRLQPRGYTYRFEVDVDGIMVYFEPDEEQNLRAIIPPEEQGKIPPSELLRAIGEAIREILK
jgi:hypothetical protein